MKKIILFLIAIICTNTIAAYSLQELKSSTKSGYDKTVKWIKSNPKKTVAVAALVPWIGFGYYDLDQNYSYAKNCSLIRKIPASFFATPWYVAREMDRELSNDTGYIKIGISKTQIFLKAIVDSILFGFKTEK